SLISSDPPIFTLFPYTTLFRSVTLGLSELEIIHHLDEIKEQIIYEETRMREWFYHNRALTVRDAIFRSYGLQRYEYRITHRQCTDRKSTRLNSSHVSISYAVFC